MKKNLRRISLTAVIIILVACLGFGGLASTWPARSFPQTEGEIRLPGLQAPVEVLRDANGIPHIYAANTADLFFAQGYVQAQDRFYQMDVWRHIGAGRLSEMFGSTTLSQDRFLRTLQLEKLVAQELTMLDSESRLVLEAFAAGVNAYLAARKPLDASLEYAVVGVLSPGYQPQPWQPTHTLLWAKMMAWDLGSNLDEEIMRAVLLKTIHPTPLEDIFPPYPYDLHPVIVPDFQAAPVSAAALQPAGQPAAAEVTAAQPLIQPALAELAGTLAGLEAIMGAAGGPRDGIGSNNWVIAGSRTASGLPLLADDPHLSVQMPAIWYEVGLHCTPKGPDCPYNVVGFAFSASPGIIIGHNDRIAWGVTNVGPDVQDLYIEKLHPDNHSQYEFRGEWLDVQESVEMIQVGSGDPISLTVRSTIHGPLIENVYGDLEDYPERSASAVPAHGHYALALRWTALEPVRVYQAILGIDRAENWEAFRAALQEFSVPAQNFVYADVDGNIGYQMPGLIPQRAASDGKMPVPGWTGEYEWNGYLPYEELPYSFNPPAGYLATANNAVVGPDYPYLITSQWDYGYRAERIVELIETAPGPIDLAYMQQVQGDNKNLNAQTLIPVLETLPLSDERLAQARDLLAAWDQQQSLDSPGGALFEVFWVHLLAAAFHDDLPEQYWPGGGSAWFEIVRRLASQPNSAWWDDLTTEPVEGRDDIFRQALEAAVDDLEDRQGRDPQQWAWGKLHTLTLQHTTLGSLPLIGKVFNRGPFETAGGSSIINATSWSAVRPYQVRSYPSLRIIADLSNWQNSLSINTAGQSGHAYHPHYVDQIDQWRTLRYHPLHWDRQAIESSGATLLRLLP